VERLKLSDLLDLAIARHLQGLTARISAGVASGQPAGRPRTFADARVFIDPHRKRPESSPTRETTGGNVFQRDRMAG
jgi:hypothetical protein